MNQFTLVFLTIVLFNQVISFHNIFTHKFKSIVNTGNGSALKMSTSIVTASNTVATTADVDLLLEAAKNFVDDDDITFSKTTGIF